MSGAIANPLAMSGRTFVEVFRAGALSVARQQEALNRINVFPVRDADTGVNMAATLLAAAARLGDEAPESFGAAARAAADAALVGARGNSGAILAQFLHGFALAVKGAVALSTAEFAVAAHQGTKAAYSALADPREGTMLSVLRGWAQALRQRAPDVTGFEEFLRHGLAGARASLAETPRQLDILARCHVVDAGGQGFVYFLEGVWNALRGDAVTQEFVPPAAAERDPSGGLHDVDERFRFCTEALVTSTGAAIDRDALIAAVGELGESLVVAGGDSRLRVHVHTNEPRLVLETVAGFGALEQTKIDDMILQQTGARTAGIAIVTDSACELPEREAFELGLVTVPLTLSIDGRSYLDGVDLTLDGFLQRLQAAQTAPVSSQPSVAEFSDVYRRLLEYREGIVSVHIAAVQSGTWQSARAAAQEVDAKRIRVIDSHTNSVGAGLLMTAVSEALRQGASLDDLERLALRTRDEITVFGAVQNLTFAVRGGRVSPRAARIIDGLHLKPIIVFDDEGRAGKGGAAVGFRKAMDSLARHAERFAAGAPVRLMITHTDAPEWVEYLRAQLIKRLGAQDIPAVRSGAVLTAHVGPGTVSVAVRRLPPNGG